jgi:uncharacterized protein YbjT (DUF2867 family)
MILVTGATGNVGKELVPQLLETGAGVRVLVRDANRALQFSPRAERVEADLDRPETLRAAMAGVRAVYVIAFQTSQVENVVNAARAAGVSHIVRQSTIEAGTAPPIGPGQWHREQEELIERSGIAWTHVRPTMMMANTVRWWAESIQAQGKVFFPGGDGRVSPVDARDIAAVGRVVLTGTGHAGHAYDVTGPQSLTIGEMVETLGRVLNRPIQYVDVPEAVAGEWMMERLGVSSVLAAALVETLAALRSSQFAGVADTVQRLTGSEGRSYEAWCRENAGLFRKSPAA